MSLLKMLGYVILLTVITFPATVSAGPGSGQDLAFPAISSTSKAIPAQCVLQFNVISFYMNKGAADSKTTSYPLEALPVSTLNFTYSHINKFLANPARFGDRFTDVTRQNCRSTVEFYLTLSHLGETYDVQELWYYTLTVGEKNGGKIVAIARYITSAQGEVLYGKGDKVNPYWGPGSVRKGRNALLVDIVGRDGEKVDLLVYPLRNRKDRSL